MAIDLFTDSVAVESVDIPADIADDLEPQDVETNEPETPEKTLVCETCGVALDYSGRGRPPRFCDEHKKKRAASPKTARSSALSDAAIAAKTLDMLNNTLALGLMVLPGAFSMPETAAAITEASDEFEKSAREALELSPKLAATLARAGGMSGGAALLMAYAGLAMAVAPVAREELAAKAKA